MSLESEKGGKGKKTLSADDGRTEIRGILRGPRGPKKGIFYKMVDRRGKCPKNIFFTFLVFFHIDTTYIKLDWRSIFVFM